MAEEFKRVGGGLTFVKLKDLKPGQEVVTGEFQHSKVIGDFGNLSHFFSTDNGDVAVNGCGHLNYLLKNIQPGTRVRIIYAGQEIKTKGNFAGKPFHSFELYKANGGPQLKVVETNAAPIVASKVNVASTSDDFGDL